jgi:glycosyltransferase involved in cell wall biosynthesis
MIVKNESHVIERCIKSVRPLIDYILIVDTGSTDDTVDVIKKTMTELMIEGEVISDTWVNFAKNRSYALSELRKREFIDYALMIDADEILQFSENFDANNFKTVMDKDLYDIPTQMGGISYLRPQLSSNRRNFRYEGVVYEFLTGEFDSRHTISEFWNVPIQDSNRNKSGNKFEKDVEILKETLEVEQDPWFRSRYTFYLAQSLRDLQRREESLKYYLERATMGYWDEECYISYYNAGTLMKELEYPEEKIIQTYLKGHEIVPTRLECLWAALQFCRIKGYNQQGWMLAQEAIKIKKPDSGLFLENWIYDYGTLDEFSIVAFYTGHFERSRWACLRLLDEKKIPDYYIDRIKGNLKFAIDRL